MHRHRDHGDCEIWLAAESVDWGEVSSVLQRLVTDRFVIRKRRDGGLPHFGPDVGCRR